LLRADDPECRVDLSSLLQLDVEGKHYPKKREEQCLKFLHIPKTGGTSIDSANMHLQSPAFDSLMLRTYQRIADDIPQKFQSDYGGNLGTMYDVSHASTASYHDKWFPVHGHSYRMVSQRDGNKCQDLHTPPGSDPSVAGFFSDCTTFCAVRDPLQRFISAYEMTQMGPCDSAAFEERLGSLFLKLSENPSMQVCQFVPQVQFVYGAESKYLSTTQYCDRILHTENLNEEFDALMHETGKALTLPPSHLMGEAIYDGCRINRADVSQRARDLIYKYYLADYEAFGYSRP